MNITKNKKHAGLLPIEEREARTYSLVARKFPRKTIMFGKLKVRLYSVAWLGAMIEKSPRAIHAWERQGMFPKPIFKLNDAIRWYCAAELHGYSKIVRACNLRSGRYSEGKKATAVLKHHTFNFQLALRKRLKEDAGSLPQQLKDESEMLQRLRTLKKFKLSKDDLEELIRP